MKFYIAAPVIADPNVKAEIDLVHKKLVETFGAESIYRPGQHKVPNAWGITMEMWGQCVFTMDVLAIDDADWIVLCNYGRKGATAGTAWECGYAFAKEKRILVLNMPGVEESSLMVTGCAANILQLADFIQMTPEAVKEKAFIERGKLAAAQTLN